MEESPQRVVRRRGAVSAEPAGATSASAPRAPRTKKTAEVNQMLEKVLGKNILFSHLDDSERLELFEYMREVKFSAGAMVIQQDDPVANDLYVVEKGELDVFKDYHDGKGRVKVYHYGPAGMFGELALMYNTPRAATVEAVTDVVLWSIDRVTFHALLAEKTQAKRRMYSDFLGSMPLLANLDKYEQLKVADCLTTETFEDGQVIIKEGEDADKFYLILEGRIRVTKDGAETHNSPLEQWQFFGELALLGKSKRAATCTAIGTVKLATMDRDSFTQLVGPCKDVMERTQQGYTEEEKQAAAILGSSQEVPFIPRRRGGVSAESSDTIEETLNWRPAMRKKSSTAVAFLENAIGTSFLVRDLPASERMDLYMRMATEKYPANTRIIKQGDLNGDKLYVVGYGELDVYKDMKDGKDPVKVFHYSMGQIFGELALMYDAPRAASVISTTNVLLYTVDRVTFRGLLLNGAKRRRELFIDFLRKIPLLDKLEDYERLKIADALVIEEFADGEVIVREGDVGEKFYLVLEGQVKVERADSGETHNSPLEPWQFFGELALLEDAKRVATCSAIGQTRVASLDRASFDSLLGPVKLIMARHKGQYEAGGLGAVRKGSGSRKMGISSEPTSTVIEERRHSEVVDGTRSAEEIELLERILGGSVLLAALDFRGRKQVYDAMMLEEVDAGQNVIKQGEKAASKFYVVVSGELDVFKDQGKGSEKVFHYGPGGTFGELALMYDTPRAATVTAVTPCKLWSVDRTTFRHLLMTETKRRRERYSEFLGNVPVLANLDKYERLKIADALTTDYYEAEEVIVAEGTEGDRFFLIIEGTVRITVKGEETHNSPLGAGQYFGELALLNNEVRRATCTAASHVRVAYMKRKDFTRLMGPVKDIMERSSTAYSEETKQ